MPDPAGTDRNARDVALKALIRAVALPVLVVVFNAVRNGWSTSMAAMTLGIGVPLLWIALFVADYYIQPAVERRNAQRRAPQRPNQNRSARAKNSQGPRGQNAGEQNSGSAKNGGRKKSRQKSQQKSQRRR
jgi:hypothetical protein